MAYSYPAPPIPRAFIWRRAHSLTGIWLVLFLIEHLLTNSQAALLFGDHAKGFVSAVNFLQNLPYLPVIEIVLLGIPFLVHGWWGIRYLMTAEYNAFPSDGTKPALPQYERNKAYTWQRITSWILLVGIVAHVIHMRFIEYPASVQLNGQSIYFSKENVSEELYMLSEQLQFELLDLQDIQELKQRMKGGLLQEPANSLQGLIEAQHQKQKENWISALERENVQEHQLIAVSPSFGVIELLLVRRIFKSPLMIFLYTGLVLATCFHAFNGLWTAMITWGITLTARSQMLMRSCAIVLMVLVSFLGLTAIWGTYLFNLIHR